MDQEKIEILEGRIKRLEAEKIGLIQMVEGLRYANVYLRKDLEKLRESAKKAQETATFCEKLP